LGADVQPQRQDPPQGRGTSRKAAVLPREYTADTTARRRGNWRTMEAVDNYEVLFYDV